MTMTREEALFELLHRSYRRIELVEGAMVQFVGVHVLRWGKVSEPEVGFNQWDEKEIEEEIIGCKDIDITLSGEVKCPMCGQQFMATIHKRIPSELIYPKSLEEELKNE